MDVEVVDVEVVDVEVVDVESEGHSDSVFTVEGRYWGERSPFTVFRQTEDSGENTEGWRLVVEERGVE